VILNHQDRCDLQRFFYALMQGMAIAITKNQGLSVAGSAG
jgi:hypothetical protein